MPAVIDHQGSNFPLEIVLWSKLAHSYFLTKESNNYKLMKPNLLKCNYYSLTEGGKKYLSFSQVSINILIPKDYLYSY